MTLVDFPQPKDKVAILRRIPVFASCSERQLALIAERTRLLEYKKGEHVYREGDAAEAFYIVVSGRLRVFSRVAGAEKTFTVLHNGDSFGEISLLTGETHSATVEALNDTLVLELEKQDFEDLINRIPSLVLYLSRLVSKRLRMKELGGEYAEATIVAIYSAARGVGRTLFAMALAAMLRREARRDTVVLDLSVDGDRRELYGEARAAPFSLPVGGSDLSVEQWSQLLVEHPLGFSVLPAAVLPAEQRAEQAIAPLLSALTKRFAYILIDLPAEVDARVFKALTQSDLIYLLTDQHRDHFVKTKALVDKIQTVLGPSDRRIKIIVNLMAGVGIPVSLEAMGQELGFPVASSLPRVSSLTGRVSTEELASVLDNREAPYTRTVRRLARELSGSLVGLALGSGAALGLAHIGVLKVLERERIPIDVIAGSSIGSLVAGLWASGHSAEDLEQMALRFKNPWDVRKLFMFDLGLPMVSVITGAIAGAAVGSLAGFWTGLLFGFMVTVAFGVVLGPLAGGPIQGAQLMAKLEVDFAGKTFEETRIPLKVVAANPMSREEVIFESGSIAAAVRASVSIPGIFKPVIHKGKICLDGGVINPVPVSVLKRAGANRVIAVNVFPTTPELTGHLQELQRRRLEREVQMASRSFPVRFVAWLGQELQRSVSPLVFDVIMRSMQSMEYQIAEVACHEAELTLRPTVAGSHWLEFFSPEKFIRRGEEVALEHLTELKRLAGVADQNVDKP